MKSQRFQYQCKQSASKFHQKVGDILRNSNHFKHLRIFQEYPVSKVNSNCINNRLHFDWVILDLKLVIECQGQQHEKITDFSGKQEDGGYSNFRDIQYRDNLKKNFAENAGYTYIAIDYNELNTITDEIIYNKYQQNFNELTIEKEIKPASNKHKEELENAKRYRQENYRRQKQKHLEYQQQRSKQGTNSESSSNKETED